MSTSDKSDLEQRALAATRDAARRKAEQDKRAGQEAAQRQAAQRHAQWEQALIAFAISRMEEILGHRTSPAEWKITTCYYSWDELQEVQYVAYTSLLGLTIKTDLPAMRASDLLVQMPYGRWQLLTSLEKFGEVLEAWKGILQPPQAWPPKGSSYCT